MQCPNCQINDDRVYVGLNAVECPNSKCSSYKVPQEVKNALKEISKVSQEITERSKQMQEKFAPQLGLPVDVVFTYLQPTGKTLKAKWSPIPADDFYKPTQEDVLKNDLKNEKIARPNTVNLDNLKRIVKRYLDEMLFQPGIKFTIGGKDVNVQQGEQFTIKMDFQMPVTYQYNWKFDYQDPTKDNFICKNKDCWYCKYHDMKEGNASGK